MQWRRLLIYNLFINIEKDAQSKKKSVDGYASFKTSTPAAPNITPTTIPKCILSAISPG